MCQEHPQPSLDDFVDGLLDDEGRTAVAAHLQQCPTCAARVEALHQARGLLQQVKPIAPSHQFEQRLETRLRQDHLKREGLKLLALGLAAVVALLRLLLVQPGSERTSAASTPNSGEEGRQTNL